MYNTAEQGTLVLIYNEMQLAARIQGYMSQYWFSVKCLIQWVRQSDSLTEMHKYQLHMIKHHSLIFKRQLNFD